MILSRQLHAPLAVVPKDFATTNTQQLLASGLVALFLSPGVPTYTAIGTRILHKIEGQMAKSAESMGYAGVELPLIVNDRVLEGGEPVGEQFGSKFVGLNGRLQGFHLLNTPEMVFAHMLAATELSWRSIPLLASYTTSFFRQMPTVKPLLTNHQFRIFGTVAVAPCDQTITDAYESSLRVMLGTMRWAGLPYSISVQPGHARRTELLYPTPAGDCKNSSGERALSLAVGYEYGDGVRLPVKFRQRDNTKACARVESWGLCSNRLLWACMDHYRDALGFSLPRQLRPFDAVIVPRRGAPDCTALYRQLADAGVSVALDDRMTDPRARIEFAKYLGAPVILEASETGITATYRGDVESRAVANNLGEVLGVVRTADATLARAERGAAPDLGRFLEKRLAS